jgi:hypothetical protein
MSRLQIYGCVRAAVGCKESCHWSNRSDGVKATWVPTSRIYSWRGDARFQPRDVETPGFKPVEESDAPILKDIDQLLPEARIEITLENGRNFRHPVKAQNRRTRTAMGDVTEALANARPSSAYPSASR